MPITLSAIQRKFQSFSESIIYEKHPGRQQKLLFAPLLLISCLYSFLVQTRNYLYQKKILKTQKLACKVISIGNITVGGTGKTPATIYLARLFQGKGKRVVVLSRGYKSKNGKKIRLVSDGTTIFLGPKQSGDEPYLLAKRLEGVPIVTGRDRFLAGKYALSRFSPDIILLDDGFQHLRLKRDLDIVLIDAARQLGNGHLIPRGILRESPKNLRRASLFLLTHTEEANGNYESLKNKLKSLNARAEIFTASHKAQDLFDLEAGERENLDYYLQEKKVMALSGIAEPRSFFSLLTAHGAIVKEKMVFPDHHSYSRCDIEIIQKRSKSLDMIVTTEKDAVKIKEVPRSGIKIMVLSVNFKVKAEEKFENLLWDAVNS